MKIINGNIARKTIFSTKTEVKTASQARACQNARKTISFSRDYYLPLSCYKNEEQQDENFKQRFKELEDKGIETLFAARIASFNDENFAKANELIDRGINVEFIEDLISLKQSNYEQALKLWDKGVFDANLYPIAALEQENFKKAILLMKKGIDSDCVTLFLDLTSKEYESAINLLQKGYPPIAAVHFCKLTPKQLETAEYFVEKEADVDVASEIAQFDEKKRGKCIYYTALGINPEFVGELADLTREQRKKLPELISLKVGDVNLADFAKLNKKDYKKAIKMLNEGVFCDYITFIIDEENKKTQNEYKTYRGRNYSKTTSFALSLLSNQEIDILSMIMKKHPEIKKLYEDEYDINIVDVQNDNTYEAVFTKETRTPNGTKITLVKTFNEYGETTISRREEYSDNSISSIMSGKSGVFKTKYDSNGEIRELTEYVQSPDKHDVVGIIHTKKSELLSGVFESTYYNVSNFKTSKNGLPEAIDENIGNCIAGNGTPISTVEQNADGSVTYTESLQTNEMLIDRVYTEKRDDNGEIIFSAYKYKIQNENEDKPAMDISREFKRNADGSVDNTINGIKYHINYDDGNKVIFITDGNKKRRLFVKGRLAYYSQDVLWKEIKNLQVDTLLDIFYKIKQWNYCLDGDSCTNCFTKSLSTGSNNSIILHETGHILSNEEPSILDNEKFVQTYGEEMQAFQESIPYNEQNYVQYFSPRAGELDADGDGEFVAETNILLTTYGTTNYKIKTRTQFLEKYFPRTIAVVAELLGKNSRKSLLE